MSMKETEQQLNQTDAQEPRRGSLKALGLVLAGGVWSKPVVESVVLPAHAESTPTTVVCPSIEVELVAEPTPSGNACVHQFVVLSADPGVPVEVTSITSDLDGNNLGVVVDDTLPAEATNSEGVGFSVISIGFIDPQDPNTCTFVANPEVVITVEWTCEGGEPAQQTFNMSDLVPTLDEDEL